MEERNRQRPVNQTKTNLVNKGKRSENLANSYQKNAEIPEKGGSLPLDLNTNHMAS